MTDDRCPLCGGNFNDELVIFTADLKPGILVIKDVPARVCSRCGYESIPYNIAVNIEKTVYASKAKKVEVEVVRYDAA